MLERALVIAAIGERQSALALLLSIFIVTFIPGAIWPRLDTVTMLFVIEPLTFVVCSVCVGVGALALCLVIFTIPLAISYAFVEALKLDMWMMVIISSSILTSIQVIGKFY